MYRDIMFKTKKVQINRFDKVFKTGASRLAEQKGPKVSEMLELLIEYGFDVNARFNDDCPTLLEQFIMAITKNYPVIELLIKYGADINATHSHQMDKDNKKITLLQFVKERGNSKLKKIFLQEERDNK